MEKSSETNIIKQLAPGWIISFAACYMLFIYEPLMMYCTNKDDFWFDAGIMAKPMLGIFLLFFLGMAAVLTVLYLICYRFSPKVKSYNITVTVIFLVFLALYIQGNFLAGNLPALDGSEIDWGAYVSDNVITVVMLTVLAAAGVFAVIKLGSERAVKYAAWVSLAVFAMINVSLVTTSAQKGLFQSKNNFISTADDLKTVSSDKNFFIFMVDSQSATEFSQVITQEQFRDTFDDFTYFPDTLSVYAYTRDSVPFVLSGHVNRNDEDFGEYSQRALNGSVLFSELDKRGYDISLYDSELAWYGKKDVRIKNDAGEDRVKLSFGAFMEEEMRYVWFKYLPYAFKKATDIQYLNFNRCIEKFDWRNDVLYREFGGAMLSKTAAPQFGFIHAEGAHVPLNMDENFNRIDGGTYIQKTTATAKLIKTYIECLKENGAYDNSVIIIIADHGYQPARGKPDNYILSRFNPILLIKGVGERHDFAVSDKPVSFLDLPAAYADLLEGKHSTELFPEAQYPRTRTVIWYEIYKEEHMVEYETDGAATEWDKFRETGNVFDLSKK